MRLLQGEIDVVPGRKPQQPAGEGTVGPGSAVLRLENASAQENAYTIRLRCESAYWQDDWYALRALPATDGGGAPATGKADQYGPGERWVKIFVSRGGARDIQILFDLPQKPDSRAGLYPFQAVIETHVGDGRQGAARGERFTELPGIAIVRPFYRWSLDVTPEERRVGILRRSSEFEVVVTNEGNDWLYCDLKPPRHKDLLLDAPAVRLAVPPPEPGEEHLQRTVPLRAVTRLKGIRGAPVPHPLPLTAARVDAPSVPPLPEQASYSAGSANTGASVIATPTSEVVQAPSERALLYCPPIPSTLTGFFGSLVQNAKGLLMAAMALSFAIPLLSIAWERIHYNGVFAKPDPQNLYVEPGGKLPIRGGYLTGSVILIRAEGKVTDVKPRVTQMFPLGSQKAEIQVPKDIEGVALKDGRKIQIAAQRAGILSALRFLLPRSEFSTAEVQVGKEVKPPVVIEDRVATTGGRWKPGNRFWITFTKGPSLPEDAAPKVFLGGVEAEVETREGNKILVSVPQNAPEGPLQVEITPSDGGNVTVKGQIEVVSPSQVVIGPDGKPVTPVGPDGKPVTPVGPDGKPVTPPVVPPVVPPPVQPPRLPMSEVAFNDLINKKYGVALNHANEALRRSASSKRGLAVRALALARLGREDAARSSARKFYQQFGLSESSKGQESAIALAAYGVLLKRSKPEQSREYFQTAQKAWPGIVDVLQNDEL